MRGLVVVVAVFLVNLPAVHNALVQLEVARQGREVSATVLDAQRRGGDNFVDYRLPRSIDPDATRFSARLKDAEFRRAEESGRLTVRAVPGKPSANLPLGAEPDRLLLVIALAADGLLLLIATMAFLARRHRDDEAQSSA